MQREAYWEQVGATYVHTCILELLSSGYNVLWSQNDTITVKDCALLTANKIITFMTHAAEKEHPGPRAAEVEPQRLQEHPATQRLMGQQRQQRPVLEADHGRQVGIKLFSRANFTQRGCVKASFEYVAG